jgi:hypothetical protein
LAVIGLGCGGSATAGRPAIWRLNEWKVSEYVHKSAATAVCSCQNMKFASQQEAAKFCGKKNSGRFASARCVRTNSPSLWE